MSIFDDNIPVTEEMIQKVGFFRSYELTRSVPYFLHPNFYAIWFPPKYVKIYPGGRLVYKYRDNYYNIENPTRDDLIMFTNLFKIHSKL